MFAKAQVKSRNTKKPGAGTKIHLTLNRALSRQSGHLITPKLKVSQPENKFEQEADIVADKVVSTETKQNSRPPNVSKIDDGLEVKGEEQEALFEDSEEQLLTDRIKSIQATGKPLPQNVLNYMQPRFGQDFSHVRIHTGVEATRLSERMHAKAFAFGNHIAFGQNQFQPETHQGKKLIAHELTHVVQQTGSNNHTQVAPKAIQRVYIPGISEAAEAVGDAVDSAGEFIADQGWKLVRRYAPKIEPVIRKGPFTWLKEQIEPVFDSVFSVFNKLNPGKFMIKLSENFGKLLKKASEIITALMKGDCKPLMKAIKELKTFVTEAAGQAWDKLTDFLKPVGDFFSDLWSSVGAPAVEWIKKFAGDLWDTITQFGKDIWDWTQPIRDTLARAWNWVKEKLFGPSDGQSGNNQSGIVSWIKEKAGEAWDWVKEKTKPVWEPIKKGVEYIAEFIPPKFLKNMGEKMTELSQDLAQTEQQMGADGEEPGGGVAKNRQALSAALPSLKTILATVRSVIVGAKDWLTDKLTSLSDKIGSFFSQLRSNSFTSTLANGIKWLEESVKDLTAWGKDKVGGIFDFLVKGFDWLTPFIEKIADVIGHLITVATNLLMLPKLILGKFWGLIPKCIREPIKKFVLEQILSRIPVFGQFVKIKSLWQKLKATAFKVLKQVFVDGNIPGAAWTFFKNMLSLIGIPAKLVVQILAKAAGAIGSILTNPLGFIKNTLKALWLGFKKFFKNFGTHFMKGVSGWLFGTMKEGGITPPKDLSLKSLLGVVMQILDITKARIFKNIEEKLGPKITEKLRKASKVLSGVWKFVTILVKDGVAGLWKEIKTKLSNLGKLVINTALEWVSSTIIAKVTQKILTSLEPTGIMAVINALIAIYKAIESFVEHIVAMLKIVNTTLNGIVGIAKGKVDTAAGYLEDALAKAIPVAISFLANQASLGKLGKKIKEIVEGIRNKVDGAIKWLIDRGLKIGKGFINLLKKGVDVVKAGANKISNWWKAKKTFKNASGEDHSIYIKGKGKSAKVMVASDPTTYSEFIENVKVKPDKQAAKTEAKTVAGELDTAIANANKTDNRATGSDGKKQEGSTGTDHALEIEGLMGRLSALTAQFMPVTKKSTPPVYGSLNGDFGSSATVMRLGPVHGRGSSPTSGNMGSSIWGNLSKRKQGKGAFYIKGHLLNDNLGGPGNTWNNLTPLSQKANADHKNQFEKHVKLAVNGTEGEDPRYTTRHKAIQNLKTVNFVVTANYSGMDRSNEATTLRAGGGADDQLKADIIEAEKSVPNSLDCHAYEIKDDGTKGPSVSSYRVDNAKTIDRGLDAYSVHEGNNTELIIATADASELTKLRGVTPEIAKSITDKQKGTRPFNNWADLISQTDVTSDIKDQILSTPNYNVQLYKMK